MFDTKTQKLFCDTQYWAEARVPTQLSPSCWLSSWDRGNELSGQAAWPLMLAEVHAPYPAKTVINSNHHHHHPVKTYSWGSNFSVQACVACCQAQMSFEVLQINGCLYQIHALENNTGFITIHDEMVPTQNIKHNFIIETIYIDKTGLNHFQDGSFTNLPLTFTSKIFIANGCYLMNKMTMPLF